MDVIRLPQSEAEHPKTRLRQPGHILGKAATPGNLLAGNLTFSQLTCERIKLSGKMSNPKSEFFGIYAPTFYLLTTFFAQQFALCVTQPPSDVTGPSGSSMMCFGVFFFNAVLWLPAGIICIIIQVRRSRDLRRRTRSDSFIHTMSAAIGILFLLFTAKSAHGVPGLWPLIAIAGAVNLGICGFFFGIGCSLRSNKRLPESERTIASKRSTAPASNSTSSDRGSGD
jgi:hypothetical protein